MSSRSSASLAPTSERSLLSVSYQRIQSRSPPTPIALLRFSSIFFSAVAFNNPTEFIGKEISLAGDESTPAEIQVAFKHVFGYDMPVADASVGQAIKAQMEDLATMYRVRPLRSRGDPLISDIADANLSVLPLADASSSRPMGTRLM